VSAERAHPAAQTPPTAAPPATDNLVGLAMSGGGIRSATFGLGALQALHKLGLLGIFDYVSTVSGGGFTGAW
jgi:predicted acylesterase/phospholipase RssA